MAYYSDPHFEKRLRKLVKRHNRLATAGVVHKMQSDGLVVAKPRIYAPKFPWVGLALLVASVFMFKGYLHHALGAQEFAARSEALATGSLFEQAGALAMFADPITLTVSNFLGQLLG